MVEIQPLCWTEGRINKGASNPQAERKNDTTYLLLAATAARSLRPTRTTHGYKFSSSVCAPHLRWMTQAVRPGLDRSIPKSVKRFGT
eukprot:scaffold6594_cov162-Amphora_coffeaeformis.AAC.7